MWLRCPTIRKRTINQGIIQTWSSWHFCSLSTGERNVPVSWTRWAWPQWRHYVTQKGHGVRRPTGRCGHPREAGENTHHWAQLCGEEWPRRTSGEKPGYSCIELVVSGSQNVLKLILKSPRLVPFGANLTQFGANKDIRGVSSYCCVLLPFQYHNDLAGHLVTQPCKGHRRPSTIHYFHDVARWWILLSIKINISNAYYYRMFSNYLNCTGLLCSSFELLCYKNKSWSKQNPIF